MDYININRDSWNKCCIHHYNSKFYDVESFIEGKSSLNEIELSLLGNIKEKNVIHLQCHFGQDSISLARLGANVVGVDLSDVAIDKAKELNSLCKSNADFICSNVYDVLENVNEKFDIVYTSYGVIGWLPDLDKWANVISGLLKENGKLVFVEFHPYIWMYDDNLEYIQYSYFKDEMIYEKKAGSYADVNEEIYEHCTWNHSISEVFGALREAGLRIDDLQEFDYSPNNIFDGMKEIDRNKFVIEKFGNKFPLVYSIVASK